MKDVISLQLCHEDPEIHDLSCKCLSLLVQLFGGEHKEAMSLENMVCFDVYSIENIV